MNKIVLLFKIIRQLKSKAVLLMLITLAAETAVIYLAGLYKLPKQYQKELDNVSGRGGFVYFDTLGQKKDIESLLADNKYVEDVLYVSFLANVKYKNDYYFLKAVSSAKCLGGTLSRNDGGEELRVVSSRSVLKGCSSGQKIKASLLTENAKTDVELVVDGVVSDDALIMNFQTGSNAVSAYNIFSPCGNDIYVLDNRFARDCFRELAGFGDSSFFPSNGIVLFTDDSDEAARNEVAALLLADNIGVQEKSEIEKRTNLVAKNNIDSYSAIPLLIMGLSFASSFAIIVMSIDSETNTVALIELIGCSRRQGTALMIAAFSLLLIPGAAVNSAIILAVCLRGRQLLENISITPESFLLLGGTVLAFLAIIAAASLLLKRTNSHIQRVVEEI